MQRSEDDFSIEQTFQERTSSVTHLQASSCGAAKDTQQAGVNERDTRDSTMQGKSLEGHQSHYQTVQHSAKPPLVARTSQKPPNNSASKLKRRFFGLHEAAADQHNPGTRSTLSQAMPQLLVSSFSESIHHLQPVLLLHPLGPGGVRKTSHSRLRPLCIGGVQLILYLHTVSNGNLTERDSARTHLAVDKERMQVSLRRSQVTDDSSSTSPPHGVTKSAPKLFAFDAIFTDNDSRSELSICAIPNLLRAVIEGSDGCLITFDNLNLIDTPTSAMFGDDKVPSKYGLVPRAISWLFHLITEQKEKTGARFSVRVSAIAVSGQEETLKDLLLPTDQKTNEDASGVYLRGDPISGTQMENHCELRAPTPEKAAHYLDTALTALKAIRISQSEETLERTDYNASSEDASHGHPSHLFFFTLHVYQYRVERSGSQTGITGGRSRLHLLYSVTDGQAEAAATANSPAPPPLLDVALSSPDNRTVPPRESTLKRATSVILALLAGDRQVPYRGSKLVHLLCETLANPTAQTCVVIETGVEQANNVEEQLTLLQFTRRLHHIRKRRQQTHRLLCKNPLLNSRLEPTSSDCNLPRLPQGDTGSEDASSSDSFAIRRAGRLGMQMAGHYSGVVKPLELTATGGGHFVGVPRRLRRQPRLRNSTSRECGYTSSSEQSCDTVIHIGRAGARAPVDKKEKTIGQMARSSATVARATTMDCHGHGKQSAKGQILNFTPRKSHPSPRGCKRSLLRNTSHAWPRAAVKNAIETLSTQKELWVDGPKAIFGESSQQSPVKSTVRDEDNESPGISSLSSIKVRCIAEASVTPHEKHQQLPSVNNPGDLCASAPPTLPQTGPTQNTASATDFPKVIVANLARAEEMRDEGGTRSTSSSTACALTASHTRPSGKLELPASQTEDTDHTSLFAVEEQGECRLTVSRQPVTQRDNQSHQYTSEDRVNPFVREWIHKHSGLKVANVTNAVSPEKEHPFTDTIVVQDDQKNWKPIILSRDVFEYVAAGHLTGKPQTQSGQSQTSNGLTRTNVNKSIEEKSQDALGNTLVCPDSSTAFHFNTNFARTLQWVRSVSIEGQPNDRADNVTQSNYDNIRLPYESVLTLRPYTKRDSIGEHIPGENNRSKCLPRRRISSSKPQPCQNSLCEVTDCPLHVDCVKRGRGRSVPPQTVMVPDYHGNKSQLGGWQRPKPLFVTTIYDSLDKTLLTSKPLSLRCPDGSSNPHLHIETSSRLDKQKNPLDRKSKREKKRGKLGLLWSSSKRTQEPTAVDPVSQNLGFGFQPACTNQSLNDPGYLVSRASIMTDVERVVHPLPVTLLADAHHDSHCPSGGKVRCQAQSRCSSVDDLRSLHKAKKDKSGILMSSHCTNVKCSPNTVFSRSQQLVQDDPKTKCHKGRLSFFTSPLFGKRKDKNFSKSSTSGHCTENETSLHPTPILPSDEACAIDCSASGGHFPYHDQEVNHSRRKTQQRNQKNQSIPNTDRCDSPIANPLPRSGCFSREKSSSKRNQQTILASATSTSGDPAPSYLTRGRGKLPSIHSISSGRGSECSSAVCADQNPVPDESGATVGLRLQATSSPLRCRCQRHNQSENTRISGHRYYYCCYHYDEAYFRRQQPHRSNLTYCQTQSGWASGVCVEPEKQTGNIPVVSHHACVRLISFDNQVDESPSGAKYVSDQTEFPVAEQGDKASKELRGSTGATKYSRHRGGGRTSSGYESILRDSEASSSLGGDSTSGSSIGAGGPADNEYQHGRLQEKLLPFSSVSSAMVKSRQTLLDMPTVMPDNPPLMHSEGSQLTPQRCDSVETSTRSSVAEKMVASELTPNAECVDLQHLTEEIEQTESKERLNKVVNSKNKMNQSSSSSSTSRRSRSAPPYSEETSEETTSSPISVRYVPPTKMTSGGTNRSSFPSGVNHDPEGRIQSGTKPIVQEMLCQIRYEKIYGLLAQQSALKVELIKTKEHLMVDPSNLEFGLHVAQQMNSEHEDFIRTLEEETEQFRRWVDTCKSRIMMITCFDVTSVSSHTYK